MAEQEVPNAWRCKQCGSSEQSSRGRCSACARAARKKYNLAHPERVKESAKRYQGASAGDKKSYFAARYAERKAEYIQRAKEWRLKNPEHAKALSSAWYAKNSQALIAKAKAWAASHPEMRKAIRSNRRARMRLAKGRLSKDIAKTLYALQKGKCPCCSKPLGDDYHLDHKMPLALGGAHEDGNMQLLRAKCNLQKSKKHPVEFMQSRGFLL